MLGLLSSVADLILGRSCAGCDEPGIVLCQTCRRELMPRPQLRRSLDLTELSANLRIPVASATDYEGAVRQVLYRFKDHRIPELASALAPALLAAIDLTLEQSGTQRADVTVLPVPTRRGSVRRRGFDHVALLARACTRGAGFRPTRLFLVDRRTTGSSKVLGAADRQLSTVGAFEFVGTVPSGPVVVIDDIVTTGATVREASAAAVLNGAEVVGVACVAGTP